LKKPTQWHGDAEKSERKISVHLRLSASHFLEETALLRRPYFFCVQTGNLLEPVG
jgi:hypothetical protein